MKELKVRLTFIEAVLGTSNADKNIHSEYIASKAPNAKTKEEEIAAVGVENAIENAMTIFPKEDGKPFFWDYQVRGFFKDSCSALQRCKGEDFSKASCGIKAYKKIIDGCIFVKERKLFIDMKGGEIGNCQRPLRASTAQGERIALANSETVPSGSTIEFTVICLSDSYEKAVIEWLNYGKFKGLGQWRNSGMGRFTWEEIK